MCLRDIAISVPDHLIKASISIKPVIFLLVELKQNEMLALTDGLQANNYGIDMLIN